MVTVKWLVTPLIATTVTLAVCGLLAEAADRTSHIQGAFVALVCLTVVSCVMGALVLIGVWLISLNERGGER